MPNLILAMLSSALVAVVMRIGSEGDEPRKPMLAVNYLVCSAVSLMFLKSGTEPTGMGFAVGLGLAGGILYLGAFLLLQRSVRENGVALSSAFMKLGVVVPTILGLTLFHERAGIARVAGILLTAAAIAALAGSPREWRSGRSGAGLLALLMLGGGMADGMSKFYSAYGNPALEGHYLCFVFTFALILCAALCARLKQRLTVRDALFGVLLGLPNYFSSRFLLRALAEIPASVAFPVFSCGTILLTSLSGRLLFGERNTPRQWGALGLALAALILLNL